MNDKIEERTATPTQGAATDFLPQGGRIVVGVDSSPASKEALRAAARLAAMTGSTIDALCVWDYPFAYAYGEAHAQGMGMDSGWSPENHAQKVLTAAVDEVFGADRPVGLRTPLVFGNPAKRILEQAEGASLIVVGSRGHGAFAGFMLGSVSTKCAAAAPCPVLVVHAPADGEPGRS